MTKTMLLHSHARLNITCIKLNFQKIALFTQWAPHWMWRGLAKPSLPAPSLLPPHPPHPPLPSPPPPWLLC